MVKNNLVDEEKKMLKIQDVKQYTKNEEIAHSVIHGIGAILGVIGLTALLFWSVSKNSPPHFFSYLIYGLSLIFLYISSTLYHALPYLKAKSIFKMLDHMAIYLLIAGTYTPFLVLNLDGIWSKAMLIGIWSIALLGVLFKLFFTGRFKILSTLLYIAMGWLIVIAYKPMSLALSEETITWILIGGLCYTFGSITYLMKKVPYHHAVWHLFVVAGSVFHYIAIVSAM